ncbi:uncharacterized protein VTP21DRAFT_6487 [Calcarisporiella thermophila]|uniref:uncharacterized protein n=1 Tax=Calcarisporiella thermophila TaxID=911321 RepID=UPI003742B82A
MSELNLDLLNKRIQEATVLISELSHLKDGALIFERRCQFSNALFLPPPDRKPKDILESIQSELKRLEKERDTLLKLK